MKVLLKRFHFNDHTARLGPQSQNSPYKTVDVITHYWSVNESAQVTCSEASARGFKFPTLPKARFLQSYPLTLKILSFSFSPLGHSPPIL